MGWIFFGVGVATGLGALAGSYAESWVEDGGGSETLGEAAAWYGNLSWIPFILVPCTFVLLLFPDGRLVSRRGGGPRDARASASPGSSSPWASTPGRSTTSRNWRIRTGVESPLLGPLTVIAALVLLAGIAGSAASLVVRSR